MTYFKIMSLLLGSLMSAGGVWVALCPERWKAWAEKVCTEKRPGWVLWADLAWLAVVLWMWFEFLRTPSTLAFVVTFAVSLTLIKVVGGIFFWKKYREMALALLAEPVALRTVMISNAAIGLALLTLGLFF